MLVLKTRRLCQDVWLATALVEHYSGSVPIMVTIAINIKNSLVRIFWRKNILDNIESAI